MSIDTYKYENAILFLCEKLGGSIDGKKKLYKLLYYVDFDRYQLKKSKQAITGDTFKHYPMGPIPTECSKIINNMARNGKLRVELHETPFENDMEVFVGIEKPDVSAFDIFDEFILTYVAAKYGNYSGNKLAALTHDEVPYTTTDMFDDIPVELSLYRNTDFGDALDFSEVREFLKDAAYNRPSKMWADIPVASPDEFWREEAV
jgi:uncharacterized phage-associated protein